MSTQADTEQVLDLAPVTISGEAHRALATYMRRWSGWSKATLKFGDPMPVSPFAACDFDTRTFTFNADTLVLNPHRVLNLVTPFRLRQEAVLTGCMLHEAGHARYSLWLPRNVEDAKALRHSDGGEVDPRSVALAKTAEEARVEALMARQSNLPETAHLNWTMRAAVTRLLPLTEVSADPNQAVMDVITSWLLRAGRRVAMGDASNYTWVGDFNALLADVLHTHLDGPPSSAPLIMSLLTDMVAWDGNTPRGKYPHTSAFMLDTARDILRILFPDGEGGISPDAPTPAEACLAEGAGQPQPGEGEEGTEQGAGEGQGGEDEASEGATPSTAARLSEVESKNDETNKAEAKSERTKAPQPVPSDGEREGGSAGGSGGDSVLMKGYTPPTAENRDVKAGASRFLRDLIDPTLSSKVQLSESPSATVDGAALAAWKAGGQVRDPMFFRRVKRAEAPQPPVQIAILVDVSSSMDSLQAPSAVLSWALSAAALDLRNFAGRGSQVSSCLIHWGNSARVITPVGEAIPGIKTHACREGTSAMAEALGLVEEQMPGFFDAGEHKTNRLLVQFTDWELWNDGSVVPWMQRAMFSGVNMLTVAPSNYSPRYASLDGIMRQCRMNGGSNHLVRYNGAPEMVWSEAAQMLSGASPSTAADGGMFA